MTQGRKEEAQKELLRGARVNGRRIPENLFREVRTIRHRRFFDNCKSNFKGHYCAFFCLAGDGRSLEERKHVGHLQDSIFKKTNMYFGPYLVRSSIILHLPFIHLCYTILKFFISITARFTADLLYKTVCLNPNHSDACKLSPLS